MTSAVQQAKKDNAWYADWQNDRHATLFDGRSSLPKRSLIRNYEFFSDVHLLNERLERLGNSRLLEVGCATGEFSRYLQWRHPRVDYVGTDISGPAIRRALEKYPKRRFMMCDPSLRLRESLRSLSLEAEWPVVYSKDVLHHQTDPFDFLEQMLEICSDTLVLRTRTRDHGATVLDPDRSCQYHYEGWMPYLVLNIDELIERIRQCAPECEVTIHRNRQVLGGKERRFLPKECYLAETGTAETAVRVVKRPLRGGRVDLLDRAEIFRPTPWLDRIRHLIRKRSP